MSFFSQNRKIHVELHWELTGKYLSKPFILDEILGTLTSVSVLNHEFQALTPETMLVYLCIHGAKHEWMLLDWVCCVAELLQKHENLNWDQVETLAANRSAVRMLQVGLQLSWMIFKAPVPSSLIEINKKDNRVLTLSQRLISGMFQHSSDGDSQSRNERFSSFHIQIRDSITDKLRYLARLVFIPTKNEWAACPLPASLASLHYLLRPCMLIMKSLSRP
jgi:hypothetical protein